MDGRDRMGATSFCRDRMGATSFCCDSEAENTTPREGSRPNGSNLFLRGRDQMGATSFLGVATVWEQPLSVVMVPQAPCGRFENGRFKKSQNRDRAVAMSTTVNRAVILKN